MDALHIECIGIDVNYFQRAIFIYGYIFSTILGHSFCPCFEASSFIVIIDNIK